MKNKSALQLLILICMNYFTFALITNIPGALLPYWKDAFSLDATSISFLGSAFFLAYGLTSLPQGVLLDKIGSKKTFIWGISLVLAGSTVFAFYPRYEIGLISLFIIGIGITALQMVGNLIVKKIDDNPDKYSRNLTLAQIFCGIGGLGGGFLIGYLIKNMGFEWQSIYYIFAGLSTILMLLVFATKIPEDEVSAKPFSKDYLNLVKNPTMLLFALGIFIYVGIEVGVATWIASYLVDMHKFSKAGAAAIVGLYWGFQAVGRLTGGFVLNFIQTSAALIIYAAGCLISLFIATLIPVGQISAAAFVMVGFFTSIMFPCIFSLAVNSFDKKQEGSIAGIICTAIVGGAVITPVIGFISDMTKSLAFGLILAGTMSFSYIAFLGFKTFRQNSLSDDQNKSFLAKIKSIRTVSEEEVKEKIQV